MRALQRLLTHSYSGKALAVKRVTENRGKRTAGVDGETWTTPRQKVTAIRRLRQRGYKPQPLRRVYIPKKHSPAKLRPLSIPTVPAYYRSHSDDFDSLVVTHRFHPLAGQRVPILFERRYRNLGHVFTCDGGRFGTITLPESFTDRALAGDDHALTVEVLVELLAEVENLGAGLTDEGQS